MSALSEFFGPTISTQFLGVFSILLTLIVAAACASMIFHRMLPALTVAILTHLMFLRWQLGKELGAKDKSWLLVYRMASLRREEVDEQQVFRIIALLQTTALGNFARSAISGAIGEWVAAGFDRQQTQPARIQYLEDLVDFLAKKTSPPAVSKTTVSHPPVNG